MAADRPIQRPQHGTDGRLWAALLDVADALSDVRGLAQPPRLVATLERLGWEMHPDHPKADNIGFRFIKDRLLVDVPAPDGLGEGTDVTTVPPLPTASPPPTRHTGLSATPRTWRSSTPAPPPPRARDRHHKERSQSAA